MEMNGIELKLLAGLPIEIDGIGKVFAPSLREIASIGEDRYNQYLSVILFDKSRVEDAKEDFGDFEYLYLVSYHNKLYNQMTLDGLKFFSKEIATFSDINQKEVNCKLGDHGVINKNNFPIMQKVVKLQNCLEHQDSTKDNPSNEKARQLLEKKKMLSKKVAKAKSSDGNSDPLTLFDLVSILASSSNYNLSSNENNPMSVWNLTMFQFNDAFNRLKIFKEYEVNVQALMNGAKAEEIQMKHWMSKITTQ